MAVLVHSTFHGFVYQLYQLFTHHKVRKSLAKVYSVILNSKLTHYRENICTYSGKLTLNIHLLIFFKSKGLYEIVDQRRCIGFLILIQAILLKQRHVNLKYLQKNETAPFGDSLFPIIRTL
jgi:hypothetical protein